MALTRARVISGDASLAEEVSEVIREALCRPREPKAVYRSVRDMRATVEREKGDHGPLDLKLAPGGLLDLDFLGQALVLAHAHDHPDWIGLDAPALFARAADARLLDGGEAERLAHAYHLLDDVHQWQRLMVEGDPTEASPVILARLARAANLPDAKALAAQLETERRAVRAIFDRKLGKAK